MTGINQQNTSPKACKELTISGSELAEMLRTAADLLEQQTQQAAQSKPFFPTNDYRRIYIEIEAQRMAGRTFPAPHRTYAELAERLTEEVGWFVDERYLRYNFTRYTKTQCLKADILRRAGQIINRNEKN